MTCKVSYSELKAVRQVVSDTSARTFEILSEIDETVGGSVWLAQSLSATTVWIEKNTKRIKLCGCTMSIDSDNTCSESLGFSQEITNSFYRRLIRSRDKSKWANNNDVLAALSEALSQLADFHNAISDLRWAIMEHDANLDPASDKHITSLKTTPLKLKG